jgi:hypothetical protein
VSTQEIQKLKKIQMLCALAILAVAVPMPLMAATVTVGTRPVSIVHVPQGGEPMIARTGSDGSIHLLYDLDGIPYYVKSSDGGSSFTTPMPVVDRESRKQGLMFEASSMAVGKSGVIYVAMSTNNWQVKLPNVPDGLVYAVLQPGAKSFTRVRSLNGRPSEGFSLAADGKGRVTATWLANKLYANFSTDNGRTFTPNAELNPSYDPCQCCTTRSVYSPNGDLAVLYREKSNNDRDMYLVIQDKTGHQTRTRVSSTLWHVNACPMTYYALISTNYGYLAAWPTKGEIYFARLNLRGMMLPPGEVKTPGHSGMRSGLVALSGTNGRILIAWKRYGELSWQLYNAEGIPQGAPESVASAGKGVAGVTDRRGHFILFE